MEYTLKPISEQEFFLYKKLPIKYIGIYELYQLYDDNLLDCDGIIVAFEKQTYLIKCDKTHDNVYDLFYYEFNRNYKCRKIVSKPDNPISLICKETEDGNPTLRFSIGPRHILVTFSDDKVITIGLSHWDQNGNWLDYDDNNLLNDID